MTTSNLPSIIEAFFKPFSSATDAASAVNTFKSSNGAIRDGVEVGNNIIKIWEALYSIAREVPEIGGLKVGTITLVVSMGINFSPRRAHLLAVRRMLTNHTQIE